MQPLELHSLFLDISKAFDKVWHEGLLYKLKSFSTSRNLLNLIECYLSDRFQRVLLTGQCSNWQLYLREFLKDPFWDLYFFNIYIYTNDLPDGFEF